MRVHVSIEVSAQALARLQAAVPDDEVVYQPVAAQADLDEALQGSNIALANWLPGSRGSLEFVHLAAAGIDQLPEIALLSDPDVVVSTSSGLASSCIAEYAIATILRRQHRLGRGFAIKQLQSWPTDFERLEAATLVGQPIGILGGGGIGTALAAYLGALGADVMLLGRWGVSPERYLPAHLTRLVEVLPPPKTVARDDIDLLLSSNDVVVSALPATPDTHHIINAARLAKMRPGSWLVNVGRGSAIDEAALREALDEGRPAGVTLDVTEAEPLPPTSWMYDHPAVELTPHMAGYFEGYNDECVDLFIANLGRHVGGLPVWNVVQASRGY